MMTAAGVTRVAPAALLQQQTRPVAHCSWSAEGHCQRLFQTGLESGVVAQ